MPFLGKDNSRTNAQGWLRSAEYYYDQLLKQCPECMSPANLQKIANKQYKLIEVDSTFAGCFPEYAGCLGDTLRHHHIGEDGQAAAIPISFHSKGHGEIHNVESKIGVTQQAKDYSIHFQEALQEGTIQAGTIQEGEKIWQKLQGNSEYSNLFELIKAHKTRAELLEAFPEWERYSGNLSKIAELKTLEFNTRDARAIFESGKATLDVFYETYQVLKSHPEFSDYLSARLPGTDSIMQKYSFLKPDTPIDVIEKIQLSEYKLQIAPKDNLLMFLFDKNANLYNVYDASSDMLPVLRSENDYALMISDAAKLPSAEDMVSFFGRFSELSPLEQLQLREIVTKIEALPPDVAPVANQQLLDILVARFTGEYVNGVPIEGMAEFLKIYNNLQPSLKNNPEIWSRLFEKHRYSYNEGNITIDNPALWSDMSYAANNLKTFKAIESGIMKVTAVLVIADTLNVGMYAAHEIFANGNLEGGLEIIQDWGCSTGGAFLCAAGSSALLEATLGPAILALAATGPVGIAAALIITVGVPIVTTIAFGDEASEFLDTLGETINDSFVEGNFAENWLTGFDILSDPDFWKELAQDAVDGFINLPKNWWNMWEDVGAGLYDFPQNWWDHWEGTGEFIYDWIHGTGDDVKNGTESDDEIHGGGGNDQIYGFGGNDTLYGDEGDDYIEGGAGNDHIYGGDGNDKLMGDSGNDEIHGGYGRDEIYGGDGNDTIYGDEESDYIEAGNGNDTVYGGIGDDVIIGGGDTNTLYGENGDDYISGGSGTNYIYGGIGSDTLVGSGVYSEIYGDAGEDKIQGGEGIDIIDGGADNDEIYDLGGSNTIHGGSGNDTIGDGDGNSHIYGDDGDDKIFAGGGNDTVIGGNGKDTIVGGDGDDTIYGDNDDSVSSNTGYDDIIVGGEGSDTIYGGAGNDVIIGGTDVNTGLGQDLLVGGLGNDTIYGSYDDDTIYGDLESKMSGTLDGNDEIRAGGGDDTIYAGGGNDIIFGDDGDDIIYGGDGDDTIIGGNGDDIIYGENGNDIIFGYDGDDTLNGGNGDDELIGGNGNDTVIGGNGDDIIYGNGGDDVLEGNAGDDMLDGGSGNDEIYGNIGQDTLNGGFGNDYLDGGDDSDKLFGGLGNDVLHGGSSADELFGEDGDDTLYGDSGDDYLEAGNGTDTLYGGVGNDTLVGGEGINYMYGEEGDDTFYGGNALNYMYGGDGDDNFTGGELADYIEGGAGNDTMNGGNGNNEMYGGDGDDYIYGGNDDDYIEGGNGDDHLYGGNGVNTIYGGAGNDIIFDGDNNSFLYGGDGDDEIRAGGGSDVLDGGAGNDYLQSDHGGDTYVFGIGYDIDTISASADLNTILIHGYMSADMHNNRMANNDLVIDFGEDTGDRLIIQRFFDFNSNRDFNFVFDDETVLGQYNIQASSAPIYGTDADEWLSVQGNDDGIIHAGAGNDGLSGGSGNDELYGEDGDDTLYGNDGDDILDGGIGNDQLNGGNGEDTYIFAKGYAQDTINEWGSDHSIVELTDINSDEITVSDQWGSNLLISVNDTEDVLTISNFKWGQSTFTFKFADGAEGYVDKNTWQLVLTKQPDEIEDTEQLGAELLESLYEDDAIMSDLLTEDSSTVITDMTESTALDNESDDISDMTDIQAMLLAENMSAFGNDDQVYDSMNITDMTADTSLTDSLLVSSL